MASRSRRERLLSFILALVSIGLFASLLPETSFVTRSSGAVVDAVGPIRPSFAVEQIMDDAPGVISEVRIWAAAGFDRGEAPIAASLLRAESDEPVRQVKARIQASKLLAPYVLIFPPYRPAPGEKLVLQLWVSDEPERDNYVIFGSREPGSGIAATISSQSTYYGPLAYEFIWRGTGWRAALEGSIPDLAHLAGALAAAALAIAIAVLSQPLVSRSLRNTTRKARIASVSTIRRVQAALRRSLDYLRSRSTPARTSVPRRAFYVFPWLIPAFGILHYLSNNLLIFRLSESIAVFAVTMAVVTVAFVAFWLVFKTAALAAVLTGLVGIAFFSYGHIHLALGDNANDRYLLGLGVPILLGLGALMTSRPKLARRAGTILNFGSVVLVAVPLYQIALHVYATSSDHLNLDSRELTAVEEIIAPAETRLSPSELRDVYYIILDQYPRNGSPPEFDNSDFLQELETRGFRVASQARSNYLYSLRSMASSLNMHYAGEDNRRYEVGTYRRLSDLVMDHRLGRILKTLGYRYVHVSSGWSATATNQIADLVVDFAPSGHVTYDPKTDQPSWSEPATQLTNRFTLSLLPTTAVRPFLSANLSGGDDRYYSRRHPYRYLAWLDFMKQVGKMKGPKFVFAHIVKPHGPTSFDRYGNISFDRGGWTDEHDPTVDSAFYGQVIWLNGQMLDVIDAILDNYEEPPIIVIAGDHGHDESFLNDILAAFLLPDGGDSAVYPSITSVNHFRAILDYYFELDLGLLEDRVYN